MPGSAVVVGGGLAGLSAALRLAGAGWQVTVCEAGPTFGGKMNRWTRDGFVFDTGPSLITMPWVFEEAFAAAGGRLADHAELRPLEQLAGYHYADGVRFTHTTQLPDWLRTVRQLEPRDVDGFLRLQQLGANLYEVSRRTFLRRTPFDPPSRGDAGVLRRLPLRYGWGNYDRAVRAHLRSPHLIQLFNRYPTYVGSSPYRSPATLLLIPYIEYAFGGFAVRGGLYRIVEGLLALAARRGIALCANARVVRIETAGGRVAGVALSGGGRIAADLVVHNGDAAQLPALLGAPLPAAASHRSMSGFVLLLGLREELPRLQQHQVYFSADYRREFHEIFDEQRFPDDPTVYVNAPSREDRSLVPHGRGETLFVMANAPATGELPPDARQRVFERLRKSGFPDLSRSIVIEDCWTPARIQDRYLMPGGAIYGQDSHGWRNAFLRPRNRHPRVGGLYQVGGSTHPGGGTPTVLLSAKITCELIARHERH